MPSEEYRGEIVPYAPPALPHVAPDALAGDEPSMRHNLEKKPSTLTRRLAGTKEISGADRSRVKKLLGR